MRVGRAVLFGLLAVFLLAVAVPFALPSQLVYASPDTETLRPNAAGDECNISSQTGCSSCTDHYDCVYEVVADDGSTMVGTSSTSYQRDLYNLPASSGSGTINKITLYFRVQAYGSGNTVKGAIKSDSTVTETAEKDPYTDFGAGTWGTYSQEWTTNPADSQPWEWSDIDALQIGVSIKAIGLSYTYCTQVYVVVDYTPPATPPTVTSVMVEGTGSDIYGTWVVLRGQVSDDQGLDIDEVGFEYGLTDSYGQSENSTGSWYTGDYFVIRIGSLAHGTTYHWRAYATDGVLMGYGSDMYFTTEGSDTLYEYLNTGQDSDSDSIYAANWTAMYFTSDSTAHTLTTIRLYLKRVGSPGTITVSLKHADESYKPTGADLCSGTYNGDNLSTSYGWVEFDVDDISVEASTEYTIVVRAVAGDGSNYVLWGEDNGGGLANAYGWHSTDGGISWSSDSPVDYLFEVWGNPVLAINTAAVFRGYLEDDDDDMLFVLEYENIYPPYYPDYDCPTYFSIRLYDTNGTTLLKSTSCQAWGNKPGSIYVNGDEAVALTEGSAYYLKLVLNSDVSVVASYQLQAVDWKGIDLTALDRWVITTAHSIETYYYDVFGVSVDLTEYVGSNEVLNEQGGLIFVTGIPALGDVRPDLFKVMIDTPGYEAEEWTMAWEDVTDWETEVGEDTADMLTTGAGFWGIDGKTLGTFMFLFGYLAIAVLFVVRRSREGGFIGSGLSLPILLVASWLRFLDIVFIAVTASIAILLFVYSLFWART